jgi:hypothetical protein
MANKKSDKVIAKATIAMALVAIMQGMFIFYQYINLKDAQSLDILGAAILGILLIAAGFLTFDSISLIFSKK